MGDLMWFFSDLAHSFGGMMRKGAEGGAGHPAEGQQGSGQPQSSPHSGLECPVLHSQAGLSGTVRTVTLVV